MSTDPLRNPSDPLRDSAQRDQELFRRMAREANGFPLEAAVAAAMNIIINAIRQTHGSRAKAEQAFDELMARSKGVLIDKHYTVAGTRKNVFPFHQTIEMPKFDFKKRSN